MSKHVSPKKGQNNPQTRDVNASQRVALALRLRATRMTYEQVAQQCGFNSASSARKAILRELDRTITKDVNHLRQEEMDSLDRLEQECWKRLYESNYEKSKLFAVDRILQIKARRAALMGLDVPKDTNMVGAQVIVREMPPGFISVPSLPQEPTDEHD